MPKLKKYEKLPIHVVEYHNEVLPHIYRSVGSKHLPFAKTTIIHFDSHPDLGIPPELNADDVFNKDVLFASIQIESWLLPAVFAGHIDTVIWCKAIWATQIPEGKHQFYIGRDKSTNKLRVSSTLPYFVSDCLYQEEKLLQDKKLLTLHVVTIDSNITTEGVCPLANLIQQEQSYILDIDLDFFSTRNPFREMFAQDDLATLTELYWFTPPASDEPKDIDSCQDTRRKQLDTLLMWIGEIKEGNETRIDKRFRKLLNLLKNYEDSLGRRMDDEDFEIFHGAGCATDDPELPHNISTDEEISCLLENVEKLLCINSHPPVLVTVARSSVDDYCPADQVEAIQAMVESMLKKLYNSAQFIHHYADD